MLAYLLLPILVIMPLSFSDSSFLVYPIPGWSLKWYENLFTSSDWIRAARNKSRGRLESTSLPTNRMRGRRALASAVDRTARGLVAEAPVPALRWHPAAVCRAEHSGRLLKRARSAG